MKVNKQIYQYIKSERMMGTSDEVIRNALLEVGWTLLEVDQAFINLRDSNKRTKKSVKKNKRIQNQKKKVDKRSSSSNWVLWLFLIFFTIIVASLSAGYVYYRYIFLPDQVLEYFDKVGDGFNKIDKDVEDMDRYSSNLQFEFDGISDINYEDPDYRTELENRFEYIPIRDALKVEISSLKEVKEDIKNLEDNLSEPDFCKWPLRYLDNRLCLFHDDLESHLSSINDEIDNYQEVFIYIDSILSDVNDLDSLLDRKEDLGNEEKKDDILEEIQNIRNNINNIEEPDILEIYKSSIIDILNGLENYLSSESEGKDLAEVSAEVQAEYNFSLEEINEELDSYSENINEIKENQNLLREKIEEFMDVYDFDLDLDSDDSEEEDNDSLVDITGELNKNEFVLIYGQVVVDEDMFSNGEYYLWTFSNNEPENECGFIDEEEGLIFETRLIEEGIFYSSGAEQSVKFISQYGEEKELALDEFDVLYYYRDEEGNPKHVRGEWTGKLVINSIDEGEGVIKGWLDVEYEEFVFGGEIRAEKSFASGSFIIEDCTANKEK